jgi:FecR protein
LKRREFITHFGAICTAMAGFWPFGARAQNLGGQPAADQAAGDIGQVATLQGSATVTRGNAAAAALRVNDPIFENDVLATAANSTLGITFDDQTTFSLSANTRIVVSEFVYQEGGGGNAATFNVAVGTAAFVASLVAKTGDMKITTPSATLGIRGTTGVVDVPPGAAAGGAGEPRIKLYPDSDGHVGQIEVFNPRGGRLGTLTQGASAFTIQRGPGGGFRAVPFQIPPAEAARDRGVLQRLFTSHNIGRRMTIERTRARGRNRPGPNNRGPGRQQPGRQPFDRNPRPGGPQRGPSRPPASPRRGGPGGRDRRR